MYPMRKEDMGCTGGPLTHKRVGLGYGWGEEEEKC